MRKKLNAKIRGMQLHSYTKVFKFYQTFFCCLCFGFTCNHCTSETRTTEKCMENSNCDQIYVHHIHSLHIWCNLNNDKFLYLPARSREQSNPISRTLFSEIPDPKNTLSDPELILDIIMCLIHIQYLKSRYCTTE